AHQRMGHLVILADAEVEERALGMLGKGLPLGALDLLELVDFSPLAVVGPTNALGKEGLEPGVGGSSGRRRIGHGARPERLDGTKSLEMIIDIGAASASPVHPGASRSHFYNSLMHILLFDIDGTLIRSGGAGKHALESALAEVFELIEVRDGVPYSGR